MCIEILTTLEVLMADLTLHLLGLTMCLFMFVKSSPRRHLFAALLTLELPILGVHVHANTMLQHCFLIKKHLCAEVAIELGFVVERLVVLHVTMKRLFPDLITANIARDEGWIVDCFNVLSEMAVTTEHLRAEGAFELR